MPNLKNRLKSGGINKSPDAYVKESLSSGIFMGILTTVLFTFLALKMKFPLIFIPVFLVISVAGMCSLLLKRADAAASRRAKEIDRDVLFAGRFLLVKLNAGKPLLNSIIDASKSYGVAGKYFNEIVKDIELGTTLEQALDTAYKTSPSFKFRKILFQINNSLKIGVDVTQSLEAVLDEITKEQLIEIQRYGKKLGSVTMFYMLAAIIAPSLGITLFTVIASMISLKLDLQIFIIILFLLLIIQVIFISVFRSIRPNLNI